MIRIREALMHLTQPCVRWGLFGLVLGVAATAHGADPSTPLPVDQSVFPAWLQGMLHEGGLPAVLAWVSWNMGGKLSKGIPVTVSLSEVDRKLLRRLGDDNKDSTSGV